MIAKFLRQILYFDFTKDMRIAINARFLLHGKIEGIGRYSYEIIQRLVAMHPEDEFILLFDRPYHEDFIFGKNVTPVVLFPPARHPFLWYLWFEFALPKALQQYKADVFFSPDGYLSLRSDVPTLMTIHDIAFVHFPDIIAGWVRKYYHYFTPKFLEKAQKIAAVSEFVKQDVIEYYGIDTQKIITTYNACQPIYQPLDDSKKAIILNKYSDGKPYFFFVGAIHPRKNIHRLIAAFDQFKKQTASDFKLLIAGRFAWQTGDIKTAYEQATHQADIHFLGYVSESELPDLMGAAFALTWVSLFEGFGIPLLEAMHCDIPIITSDCTAMPEVVGAAAITVSPTDAAAITAAMSALYHDAALRNSLIAKGKLQRLKFSWEHSAAAIYDALKTIV